MNYDMEKQVEVNKTDIVWLKHGMSKLETQIKRQTAVLITILLAIIGNLVAIFS